MPNTSFPAFMIFLRRLSVLVAAILALVVYVAVYNFTKSAQLATVAVVVLLALWIASLIMVLRPPKGQ